MSVEFKLATLADIPDAAAVHIDSCLDSYRGMVPDDVLSGTVGPNLEKIWAAERLANDDFMVLAMVSGRAAALSAVRPKRYEVPYIDYFHVRTDLKGQGIGRDLWTATRTALLNRGHRTYWLDVLEENTAARAFYQAMGGIEGEALPGDLFGYPVTARPVFWPDPGAAGA